MSYNLLLMRSYRLGCIPLARGTSPWLVALAAASFAGERLAGLRLIGLLVISVALASLSFAGGAQIQGAAMPIIAVVIRGRDLPRQLRSQLTAGLTGGVLSLLAYGLVLWAPTRGALAPIAALRETSIVIGAVIGTIVFHEPFGRTRMIATLLVTTGIVLMTL